MLQVNYAIFRAFIAKGVKLGGKNNNEKQLGERCIKRSLAIRSSEVICSLTWNAVCSSGIHNVSHGSTGTNPKKGHENGWKISPIQKS